MDLVPAEAIGMKSASQLPPLIKGYLRVGAKIGDGCVIDHEFDTVDVFIVMPVKEIAARYVSYYGGRPIVSPRETVSAVDLAPAFERLRQAAQGLPEITEGTSYGTPSLNVRKKFLCRVKDPETVVLMCELEEKELLVARSPEIYFETDHYRDWPAVLVRVGKDFSAMNSASGLSAAFAMRAPKSLIKAWRQRKIITQYLPAPARPTAIGPETSSRTSARRRER